MGICWRGSLRAFSNSPGNGLFEGGIHFDLGCHLGVEKCILKFVVILTANFLGIQTTFCCEKFAVTPEICCEALALQGPHFEVKYGLVAYQLNSLALPCPISVTFWPPDKGKALQRPPTPRFPAIGATIQF